MGTEHGNIFFSLNLELLNQYAHVQLIDYQGCSPISGCQKGLGTKLQAGPAHAS